MAINKLLQVIKEGNLSWKLPKKIYLIGMDCNNLFWIHNKNIKELALEDKVYRKLEWKYRGLIKNYKHVEGERKVNRTVWICWMQGLENAPKLVKACVNSVRENLNGFKIVILTEDNIGDYVTFPDYIVEKYKKGIISRTHFSDILRVTLLAKYGGLWVDSTVLCTDGNFANYIIELPLFAYQNMDLDRNDELPIVCSTWLVSANSNNPILCLTRELVYEYWKTHKYLKNFFVFHLFFAMAARHYRQEWNEVPMYNNRSPHTLMFELGERYDEERWKTIEHISSFHKLTRHVEYEDKETNYTHILEKYLNRE